MKSTVLLLSWCSTKANFLTAICSLSLFIKYNTQKVLLKDYCQDYQNSATFFTVNNFLKYQRRLDIE